MFKLIAYLNRWHPLPHIRRLARGEASSNDFGKFVVTCMLVLSSIELLKKFQAQVLDQALGLKNDREIANVLDGKTGTILSLFDRRKKHTQDRASQDASFIDNQKNWPPKPATFEDRFGTLNSRDTVIFKEGEEHMEGWFLRYNEGQLVVGMYSGNEDGKTIEVIVDKSQVLDVEPVF